MSTSSRPHGLPVHPQFPELTQTHVHRVSDAMQPSHPLSSHSPPAFNPSQHQGLSSESVLHIRWPKYVIWCELAYYGVYQLCYYVKWYILAVLKQEAILGSTVAWKPRSHISLNAIMIICSIFTQWNTQEPGEWSTTICNTKHKSHRNNVERKKQTHRSTQCTIPFT